MAKTIKGPKMTPEEKAHRLAMKIAAEVNRLAGEGLDAARLFLEARVRETLSVKAPTRKMTVKKGPNAGQVYYKVLRRADPPPAPPRVVSGRLFGSIVSKMDGPLRALIGSNARAPLSKNLSNRKSTGKKTSGQGFQYGRYWEQLHMPGTRDSGRRPFIRSTADRYKVQLGIIIGKALKFERL